MSGETRGDRKAAEQAIAQLIRALGLEATRDPELEGTPQRVADFYLEAFRGLDPSAEPELVTFPNSSESQLVMVRDLAFHSMCGTTRWNTTWPQGTPTTKTVAT